MESNFPHKTFLEKCLSEVFKIQVIIGKGAEYIGDPDVLFH